MLDREIADDGPMLLPSDDTGFSIQFQPTPELKTGPNQTHLHLTSTSLADRQSTVARSRCPPGYQVLALENGNGLVPALDGADNPDRANVTTTTFSDKKGTMGKNHSLREAYAAAAADLPAGDPSYAAWQEPARGFLHPANQTSATEAPDTYAITREAGS